jgi:hypothetical protein
MMQILYNGFHYRIGRKVKKRRLFPYLKWEEWSFLYNGDRIFEFDNKEDAEKELERYNKFIKELGAEWKPID